MPQFICAEVNEIFRNLCRNSCVEVHPCRSSVTRSKMSCIGSVLVLGLVTVMLETSLCLSVYDGERFEMLVAESLC